jgi:uncharacterized protein YceK
VRYLLAIALAAVLAGCGSASKPATPARGHAATPRAAELVNYQRNGGLAATLDTVSVRTDGSTRADKRYGGAGRRFDDFRLSAPVMARLRAALGRLPARTPAVGDGMRAGATYLLRYRGVTYVARQGAVPAALRPAICTLDAIADGAGRAGPVHHVTQAPSS